MRALLLSSLLLACVRTVDLGVRNDAGADIPPAVCSAYGRTDSASCLYALGVLRGPAGVRLEHLRHPRRRPDSDAREALSNRAPAPRGDVA